MEEGEGAVSVTCNWCKQPCDNGSRAPVLALPCKHVGCTQCVRTCVVTAKEDRCCFKCKGKKARCADCKRKYRRNCPVCKAKVTKYTIEGAPVIEAAAVANEEVAAVGAEAEGVKKEEASSPELTEFQKKVREAKNARDLMLAVPLFDFPEDWACCVCSFNFDHRTIIPMHVTECFAIEFDYRNRNADRGQARGCEHTFCSVCLNKEMKENGDGARCYICRASIRLCEVNMPLLKKMAEFKDGCYLGLVPLLNSTSKELSKLQDEMVDMKKHGSAPVMKKQLDESLAREAATRDTLVRCRALLNATSQRQQQLTQEIADMTAGIKEVETNTGYLVDEVLDLRLGLVNDGTLTMSQTGIDLREDKVTEDGTVYHRLEIQVGKGNKKRTIVTGLSQQNMTPSYQTAVKRLREYDAVATAKATYQKGTDSLLLPTPEEVNDSFFAHGRDHLVQRGSWVHQHMMQNVNTVEATFDGVGVDDPVTGSLAEGRIYQVVNSKALEAALQAYRKLAEEEKQKTSRKTDIAAKKKKLANAAAKIKAATAKLNEEGEGEKSPKTPSPPPPQEDAPAPPPPPEKKKKATASGLKKGFLRPATAPSPAAAASVAAAPVRSATLNGRPIFITDQSQQQPRQQQSSSYVTPTAYRGRNSLIADRWDEMARRTPVRDPGVTNAVRHEDEVVAPPPVPRIASAQHQARNPESIFE